MKRLLLAAAIAAALCSNALAAPFNVELEQLGTYASGRFEAGAAEIVSYDPLTRRAFVVNAADTTVDVLDIRDPAKPTKVATLDASTLGGSANSVDVQGGIVAVAIEAALKTDPGLVAFYRSRDLRLLKTVPVGALPDMVTFTPDGRYVLVANEGEPNDDYSIDPEGSVSVIDLGRGVHRATVRHATFTAFNPRIDALRASGVRIYGPNATVAQDLEPEYIAVDGRQAYVTLQEANSIAVVDIPTATMTDIRPLGFKDHMLPGNGLDASDRDGVDSDGDGTKEGAINIRNWPVFGMYQPDAIAAYRRGQRTYLITANEGDTRDYDTFSEEVRMRSANVDASFPNRSTLRDNASLGRLTLTNQDGDTDGDGDLDALYVPGARSFSIWDAATGLRVFDSGSDFEGITGNLLPAGFNANNDANNFPQAGDPDDDRSFDTRSDNKGPEPEGLAVGQYLGRTYAFIGLERTGGVMVYDITDPADPEFMQYLNNRDFTVSPTDPSDEAVSNPAAGDLGPEGLHFVPWHASPTLRPLLLVGNEVSGTTTVYQLKLVKAP